MKSIVAAVDAKVEMKDYFQINKSIIFNMTFPIGSSVEILIFT